MDRWNGKIAVVTGASSGIGLTTAKTLVSHGLTVVGLARRVDKMEAEMKGAKGPGKFYARQCDLTNDKSIGDNLNWVKDTLGTINVLINNAGVLHYKSLEGATVSELDQVINVNVLGPVHTIKHALPILKGNQKEAHIININSVLGHKVIESAAASLNVYPASKYAITALSQTLSIELKDSKIRVTSISPGMVKTNMVEQALSASKEQVAQMVGLDAQDVTNAIVYALGAPTHVEIKEVILEGKGAN